MSIGVNEPASSFAYSTLLVMSWKMVVTNHLDLAQSCQTPIPATPSPLERRTLVGSSTLPKMRGGPDSVLYRHIHG